MKTELDSQVLDQLFRSARSYNKFTDQEVTDETIRELYELLRCGPTSMNTQPARYLFVRSKEARERLLPAMKESNLEKTRHAPVSVIVASDSEFYEHLPVQFKAYDAKPMFIANQKLAETTAFRNSSLQGAYLIMAARALGLDCGAMSGFDPAMVDAEFFPGGRLKTNFIINLGYGEKEGYHPRGPRLDFDEVVRII